MHPRAGTPHHRPASSTCSLWSLPSRSPSCTWDVLDFPTYLCSAQPLPLPWRTDSRRTKTTLASVSELASHVASESFLIRNSDGSGIGTDGLPLTMTIVNTDRKQDGAYPSDRILSIQSHVAFGYVGGKAATFPLQCMGYDVDVVNTVNFSNHTGYARFGGTKTSAEELTRIFDSMQRAGVLVPGRLLTGYIPNAEALSSVYELVKKLKASNPNLVYLLDPVLGDAGRLYVAQNCISPYRQMLPLATIITPNWFEVEVLTEIPLTDLASLRAALRRLHEAYRVPNVVVSSIPSTKLSASLQSFLLSLLQANGSMCDERSYLICIASSVNDEDDIEVPSTVYSGCVELIPGYFSGVGDIFSALVLGHFNTSQSTSPSKSCPPLAHAASHALSRTHTILSRTNEAALPLSLPGTDDELDAQEPDRKSRRMKGRELRIIQNQDVFRRKEWDGVTSMRAWEGFWNESS